MKILKLLKFNSLATVVKAYQKTEHLLCPGKRLLAHWTKHAKHASLTGHSTNSGKLDSTFVVPLTEYPGDNTLQRRKRCLGK